MTDRVTAPPLGVPRLEDFLARTSKRRDAKPGQAVPPTPEEWALDLTLMNGLGLHVRSTLTFLFERQPTLEALERYVLDENGGEIERERIARLDAALAGTLPADPLPASEAVLDEGQLASFDEHGLVVVRDVASPAECEAARAAIWQHLRGAPDDPRTWPSSPMGPSVEVSLVRHPALDAIRRSERARRAFAQLWGRTDVWPVIEGSVLVRPDVPASARLRWEVDPSAPISLGLRGMVFLDDAPIDRGAFVTAPGFHRRIDAWLASLPRHALPHDQDLDGLVAMPARQGDLLIWHHALPYSRSPNEGATPTTAQFLTFRPTR